MVTAEAARPEAVHEMGLALALPILKDIQAMGREMPRGKQRLGRESLCNTYLLFLALPCGAKRRTNSYFCVCREHERERQAAGGPAINLIG